MNDDKQEMVTIEVPVTWAEGISDKAVTGHTSEFLRVQNACAVALDARKSKFEKWLERLSLPWKFTPDTWNIRNSVMSENGVELMNNITNNWVTLDQAKLMAGAPNFLVALINAEKLIRHSEFALEQNVHAQIVESIKVATPAEVSAEVLEES